MSGLPQMLDYPGVKPRGITTEFQKMRFTPLTSFNSYVTNDIVRFWIPMIKGFWDPYKSYLQIEVEVDATEYGYGKALQVDNSASSFISEMTVFVDSKEVQRIQQYDTVAAILHDINYTPADQFGKQYEGHGYNNYTSEGINIDQRVTQQMNANGVGTVSGGVAISATSAGITRAAISNTCAIRGWHPQYPQYINCDTPIGASTDGYTVATASTAPSVVNASFITSESQIAWPRTSQTQNTGATTTMVHAMTSPIAFYNDVGQGNLGVDYRADNAQLILGFPNQRNLVSPRPYIQAVNQSTTYGVQGTNALNFCLSDPQTLNPNIVSAFSLQQAFTLQPGYKSSASVANTGYTNAWSEELSNSSSEPVFAPAHGCSWITDGQFLPTPLSSNKKIFQIPIISSVLGVLIPIQSYQLLPMEAFKNLLLEFRLNEFAMFTSGYNEDFVQSSVDRTNQPMTNYSQLQRNWKINRFELYGAIFSFDDFVTNMMRQQLQAEGLILSSVGWSLGPQFSVPNTMAVKNSWQINAGYQSLKQLVFRIGSDDYKQWTFCRKHYYLSGNIQSLQLQISNTYIPPQPIVGHAGNIIPYGNKRNNAPFIIELHAAFGQLFNIGQNTYINSTNFAVNDRPYNPANTLSYANSTTGVVQNIDTTSGLPLFHENRCVGRALYAFDLESLPGQKSSISGLNTLQYRPFQVQIDVDGDNQFTRDATLYFFMCYDVIYKLTLQNAPEVFGRGS